MAYQMGRQALQMRMMRVSSGWQHQSAGSMHVHAAIANTCMLMPQWPILARGWLQALPGSLALAEFLTF